MFGRAYRLDADNGVGVRLCDTRDELVLGAGHVQSRTVGALAFPVGGKTSSDDYDVRLSRQLLGRDHRCFAFDLLTTTETL